MLVRIKLRIKIIILNRMISRIESDILSYRYDMGLKNHLYYCGLGDVNLWSESYCNYLYYRIAVCNRLVVRYTKKLDGVVG
jgi:hypothetical protein